MMGLVTWMIGVAGVALAAAPPPAGGGGRALAVQACTECHLIDAGAYGSANAQSQTPSFQKIADNPDNTDKVLRHFLRTTHATLLKPFNMPDPGLTDGEISAVVAYIESLKNH